MGMTIDEDILVELFKESKMPIDKVIEMIVYIASRRRNILNHLEREACANAIDTMRKYQIMQAEYNARLKADMVAMLTEIQLEIEEQRQDNTEFNIWKDGYNTANDIDCVIIQQKINALKAGSEIKDADSN